MENLKDIKMIKKIAQQLNLRFELHSLRKLNKNNVNAYESSNSLIFFYPLNDGYPTCGFEFYENGKLLISNAQGFSQINNLDEIILHMVRLYSYAIDNNIVLDPFYFMLEIKKDTTDKINGNLVVTEKAIRNHKLTKDNFDEANKHFINKFLDHFIGWNFGLSVNRNETLKIELEKLNAKVINMGIREYAGAGFEVYGTEDEVQDGIQHYSLPTGKEKLLKKFKNSVINYF